MDAFTSVLVLACVIFIGVYFYRQWKKYKEESEKATWPKEYTDCPDYWHSVGNHVCRNQFNLGKCIGNTSKVQQIDFKNKVGARGIRDVQELNFKMGSKDSLEKKCRWAKRCNVTWEGIDKLCA